MSNPPVPAPASPSAFRRTGALLTVTAVTAAGLALVPSAANAAVSADAPVVISEVYGGGGNSGAAVNRDFIELANTGDETVDLSGFSVQYASATGATWQVVAQGKAPAAHKAMVQVAKAMAATGARAVTDAALRDAAKADLARRVGASGYVSPLPPEVAPPLGMSLGR